LKRVEEQRKQDELRRAEEQRKDDEFFASFGITEELSSTERSLFKTIHKNESIDIGGISRLIPRNMSQNEVFDALKRLEDIGAIIIEDECYKIREDEEEE
ncbi:MAG: hypothetical protein IKN47_03095, partial [Lachnospiraceae bacterium]|nr:hypothetical protein [Lachnospiraceae bacterium]